jgi:polyphosphate kinase 2 (PPK2 family)
MLEQVNLDLQFPRKQYKELLPDLQRRLYDLEKAGWDYKIPSIVLFEGWDAAGKGSAIATLTQRMDPRGFKLHPIRAPRTYEESRPWLWRFWSKTPNRGEMAIFDQSWYGRVLVERVERQTPRKEWQKAYRDITEFEQMLADDGTVIVKFWLHISKKEQRKRFLAIEKDPLESWRVTAEDWNRHKKYNEYLRAAEEMFERTESEWGPWTIVEATDRWWARRKVFQTLIAALETRLGDLAPATQPVAADTEERRLREAMDSAEAALAGGGPSKAGRAKGSKVNEAVEVAGGR